MTGDSRTPFEAFDLAVTRIGGQSAMARVCGCTPGNINQLLQAKRLLPAEYVLRVELASGVSRHVLRPDIYPLGLQDGVPFNPDPLEPPLAAPDELASCERADILHAWSHAKRRAAEREPQVAA